MAQVPSITEAEWEVMEVLWAAAPRPLLAQEVVEALAGRRDRGQRSPRTVKTLLNRLVRKGALAFEADGKRYLYRPRVARDRCVREESRSFVQRIFGGAVAPMLNYFAGTARLTDEEVAELRRILDQRRRP